MIDRATALFPVHLGDLVGLGAARRHDLDGGALLLADQRARQRRGDGDPALLGVRLGLADEPTLARWGEALAAALPSVAAGDTLTGLHRPGQGAAFWHDGRATVELDDPALAQAFFAIWLDERTREPALRARLLGLEEVTR